MGSGTVRLNLRGFTSLHLLVWACNMVLLWRLHVQAITTTPLKESWQKETEKQKKEEEEGLLLILPSLSSRPPLHRLFPPPPPFLLRSILSRLPLFPVQRDAARATILEQRWHEMEVGRPVSAGERCRRGESQADRGHTGGNSRTHPAAAFQLGLKMDDGAETPRPCSYLCRAAP